MDLCFANLRELRRAIDNVQSALDYECEESTAVANMQRLERAVVRITGSPTIADEITVGVCVEGGVVQGARASHPNVTLFVADVDNLNFRDQEFHHFTRVALKRYESLKEAIY